MWSLTNLLLQEQAASEAAMAAQVSARYVQQNNTDLVELEGEVAELGRAAQTAEFERRAAEDAAAAAAEQSHALQTRLATFQAAKRQVGQRFIKASFFPHHCHFQVARLMYIYS